MRFYVYCASGYLCSDDGCNCFLSGVRSEGTAFECEVTPSTPETVSFKSCLNSRYLTASFAGADFSSLTTSTSTEFVLAPVEDTGRAVVYFKFAEDFNFVLYFEKETGTLKFGPKGQPNSEWRIKADGTYTGQSETVFSSLVALNNAKSFPAFKGSAVRKHGQKKKPLACSTEPPLAEKEPLDTARQLTSGLLEGQEQKPTEGASCSDAEKEAPNTSLKCTPTEHPPADGSRAASAAVLGEESNSSPVRRKKQIRFADYDDVIDDKAEPSERPQQGEPAVPPPATRSAVEKRVVGQSAELPSLPSHASCLPSNGTRPMLQTCDPSKLSGYVPLRKGKPAQHPPKRDALPSLPQVPPHKQRAQAQTQTPQTQHMSNRNSTDIVSQSEGSSLTSSDVKSAAVPLAGKRPDERDVGSNATQAPQVRASPASAFQQEEPQQQQQKKSDDDGGEQQQQSTHTNASGKAKSECVLCEIKETEQDYLNDLLAIERNYARQSCLVLSPQERAVLYGNLSELIALATKFNGELQQVPPEQPLSIGESFVKFKDELAAVYKVYCANHEHSNLLLKELEKRDRVRDFFQSKKNADPKKLDLKDYLIKPVQRVCRYPLLLKELQKSCGDSASLDTAIRAASDVLDATNAETENAEKFLYLYRLCGYSGLPPHLLLPNFDGKIIDSRILMVHTELGDKRPPSSMYAILTKSHILFG